MNLLSLWGLGVIEFQSRCHRLIHRSRGRWWSDSLTSRSRGSRVHLFDHRRCLGSWDECCGLQQAVSSAHQLQPDNMGMPSRTSGCVSLSGIKPREFVCPICVPDIKNSSSSGAGGTVGERRKRGTCCSWFGKRTRKIQCIFTSDERMGDSNSPMCICCSSS